MRNFRIGSRGPMISAIVALGLGASMNAASQGPVPDNVGGGLRHLIEAHENAAAAPPAVSAAALMEPRLLRDTQSRILVNIWLDGGRPLATVRESLAALGANVHAELPAYRRGVISAYVPVERASDAARQGHLSGRCHGSRRQAECHRPHGSGYDHRHSVRQFQQSAELGNDGP